MRRAVLILASLLFGCDQAVDSQMQSIQNKVAEDAVKQYEIASRSGGAIDKCVQAGLVSAAYLQAKNESEYSHWKTIEKLDCSAAGAPVN